MGSDFGYKNWNRDWWQDTKDYNKYANERAKYKYPCPKCGRKMIIAYKNEHTICDYCGTLIYKDEKAKFKGELSKMLKKRGS